MKNQQKLPTIFNVLVYDFNKAKIIPYNIIPYFVSEYKNTKQGKPKTYEEFKEFIKSKSLYMFWSRCEYEIIISQWPVSKDNEKWDVHKQIMMNIDIITNMIMKIVKSKHKYDTDSL